MQHNHSREDFGMDVLGSCGCVGHGRGVLLDIREDAERKRHGVRTVEFRRDARRVDRRSIG